MTTAGAFLGEISDPLIDVSDLGTKTTADDLITAARKTIQINTNAIPLFGNTTVFTGVTESSVFYSGANSAMNAGETALTDGSLLSNATIYGMVEDLAGGIPTVKLQILFSEHAPGTKPYYVAHEIPIEIESFEPSHFSFNMTGPFPPRWKVRLESTSYNINMRAYLAVCKK